MYYIFDCILKLSNKSMEAIQNTKWNLRISISTKNYINDLSYDEIFSPFSKDKAPKWLEELENIYKKDPILKYFYQHDKFVDDNTNNDLVSFDKNQEKNYIKRNINSKRVNLPEKTFDENMISSILNSSNKTEWFLLEEFVKNTDKLYSLHHFITIFITLQLKDDKIDFTRYVNDRVFSETFKFHRYSWFKGAFQKLNWKIVNESSWQNHRLIAVYVYNYYINKLWLENLFKKVEYIDSSKIEFYEDKVNGFWIDSVFNWNYILTEKDLNWILAEIYRNDNDKRLEIKELILKININKSNNSFESAETKQLIIPKDKFEKISDTSIEKLKSFITWFINKKPRIQHVKERIGGILGNN